MSNDAGEAMAQGAAPVRRGAVAFIFVTILLDMLALGVIMPILPKLIESFVDNDTAHAARIFGLFGTAWALMQFVFSPVLGALSDRFGRRPVVLLSNFGARGRLCADGAGAVAGLAVRRPRHLGHHLGQHLDRLCLYRRHHAAGAARSGVRQDWRCIRRRLRAGPGAGRPARRYRSAPAVLGLGGLELRQCALWALRPAGIVGAGQARAVPLEERQSARSAPPAAFQRGARRAVRRQFHRAGRACRVALDLRALRHLSLRLGFENPWG
ncbi:hypothetical protein ACVWZK_006141 [Bradyrhizobium sp. GM0.4]